jgi:transcriptional regulator with XRE-family HTH domain
MDLRAVFIVNLKKFRKKEGFSQMKLAEKCNTAASYIGEIEIGRKFPSIEMIEKIAQALGVEPYRFFKEERSGSSINIEAREFYAKLTPEGKGAFTDLILLAIGQGLEKVLNSEQPVVPPEEQPENTVPESLKNSPEP